MYEYVHSTRIVHYIQICSFFFKACDRQDLFFQIVHMHIIRALRRNIAFLPLC